MASQTTEVTVEVAPTPEEPLALVQPDRTLSVRPLEPAAFTGRARNAAGSRRSAPLTTTEASEAPSAPAEDIPTDGRATRDASAAEGSKRLSLSDLGVGSDTNAVSLMPVQTPPTRAEQDIGGLRKGLMERDTELGLGPGGKVADVLRRFARDIAPLGSQATIVFSMNEAGEVTDISLRDAANDSAGWTKVLKILRDQIKAISPWPGGALKVTLSVRSISAPRSGIPRSPTEFDVTNIGSPMMHHFHVRVLEQLAQ
jgi:hypothetical protein